MAVAQAGDAQPAAAAPETSVEAAVAQASSTSEPVVVEELLTPTERTLAMPDGTMQYEASSVPVRVEQDGEWVPVDTDLTTAGAWLEPAASARPVRFSPGGTDELSQIQTPSGEWVTETWPHGDLPTPVVDGPTATYEDVFPGVDLKLTATELGMATVYVVKTEAAAKSAALRDLHVDIEGADVVRNSTGTFTADAGGDEPIVATSPLWWDSSNGGDYIEPGGDDPMRPVVHELSDDSVSMDVARTVGSADVVYPIYIDPDWSSGENASWYTDAAFPNQSYLTAAQSDVLRVGVSGSNVSNMFFQFPISALSGKTILGATLNTTQLKALWCPAGPINVRVFGPQTPGFTWNQTNTALWGSILQSQNPGDCSSPAMPVGWDVTAGVEAKVGASTIQFGITYPAGSTNSRRHFSRDATLVVSYNTPPNATTGLKFVTPQRSCGTSAAPAMIAASQVTVGFTQTDPDPGNVGTRVYLHAASNLTTSLTSVSTGLGAQGAKTAVLTGLVNGQAYAWRGRGSDGVDVAAYSGWCYFTVDQNRPAPPTITPPSGPLTIGQPATVSFSTNPTDKVAFIGYTVQPSASPFVFPSSLNTLPPCNGMVGMVRFVCPNASGAASGTFAPIDTNSTLFAVAYDAAGNPHLDPSNPSAELGAGVGVPLIAQFDPAVAFSAGHVWLTQPQPSPLGASIPDTNTAAPVSLTLGRDTLRDAKSNPPSPAGPPTKSVLDFSEPSTTLSGPDYTQSAAAVVSPVQSFTVAAWIKRGSGGSNAALLTDTGLPGLVLGASSSEWRFCLRPISDDPVCANDQNSASTSWMHVAGVWDAVNGQMRLYVNGAPAKSEGFVWPAGTSATSRVLTVGANVAAGTVSTRWDGLIADPAVFAGVASPAQLTALRLGQDPANG